MEEKRKPAYLALYETLREEILSGTRACGSRLPSRRSLAQDRGVSPVTVDHCYELLCEEGYAESRPKSGYYVIYRESDGFSLPVHPAFHALPPSETGSHDSFPFPALARVMRRVLSDYGEAILVKPPNTGCLELRDAVSRYLARNRGIRVSPEQIVIGSGAEYLYGLVVELLGSGRLYGIESPSYETRLAILKSKAQATQKVIPEDILKFIAENIRSHVRAIEGALARIVTFMSMQNDMPLTVEIAKHLLRDSIEEEKTIKDLSISDIMKTVATFYGVTIDDILSSQRTQTLVTPRQLAMYMSRKLTTKSLQEIADEFKKTHATVLHGAQTIQKRIDVEPELKKAMEEIATRMGRKASDILE